MRMLGQRSMGWLPRRAALPAAVLAALAVGLAVPALAAGAAQVRVQILSQSTMPAVEMQQWARDLAQASVHNVSFRVAAGGETIGVVAQGDASTPTYVVTALLDRGELVVPGERFRRGEAARFAEWLNDLAANGPPETREAKGLFGLTAAQFAAVRKGLAPAIEFETHGMRRSEAVTRLAKQLSILIDARLLQLVGDEPVQDEYKALSRGTAMAALLRPAGVGLAPQMVGDRTEYTLVKIQPTTQVWPVGWAPQKTPREIVPGLYEMLNVNVQNVAASQAVAAIAQRLKTPVVYDLNALAQHELDPTTAMVSTPAARTSYSLALGKLLFQARLKFEVRLDDADTPFLWITSLKPT